MSAARSVLLTGASGYIAKHIALQLLEEGHTVRGSVRATDREHEIADAVRPHLSDPAAESRLRFVELDLMSDSGWTGAAKGMDVLVHTASPLPLEQPQNEDDIIRPAVDGTLRALRAAKAAGITRVVLTSSIAAVGESGGMPAGRIYDESDWSDPDWPEITPYAKSKTLAERAAWDFVRTQAPDMHLTVINPGLVIGPPLDGHIGTSLALVQRILRGRDPAVPNIGFALVDVRDIAAMHVRAIATPQSIGARHLGVSGFLWFPEMAEILAAQYPHRDIVTRRAPNAAVRMLAQVDAAARTAVPLLDIRRDFSSARARAIFGIDFVPVDEALRASAQFLIENGLV